MCKWDAEYFKCTLQSRKSSKRLYIYRVIFLWPQWDIPGTKGGVISQQTQRRDNVASTSPWRHGVVTTLCAYWHVFTYMKYSIFSMQWFLLLALNYLKRPPVLRYNTGIIKCSPSLGLFCKYTIYENTVALKAAGPDGAEGLFFFFFFLLFVCLFIKIRRSQVSKIKILWKHRINRKKEKNLTWLDWACVWGMLTYSTSLTHASTFELGPIFT